MRAFDAFRADTRALTPAEQRARTAHMEFLQLLRDGRLWELASQPWGAISFSIIESDYYQLIREFPELASPDSATQRAAWRAFARSPSSEPYRTKRSNLL